jgi:multidrug efflux pump
LTLFYLPALYAASFRVRLDERDLPPAKEAHTGN